MTAPSAPPSAVTGGGAMPGSAPTDATATGSAAPPAPALESDAESDGGCSLGAPRTTTNTWAWLALELGLSAGFHRRMLG